MSNINKLIATTFLVISFICLMLFLNSSVLAASNNLNGANHQLPSQLVNKNASELVLAIEDFEPGWTRLKAEPLLKEGAQSAHHVYFYKGTYYPPVVQNTVAVYPSTDLAKQAYLNEKPKNVSLEYPDIGDECFLDISIRENQRLVFRKDNVVAWFWLQQDIIGDIQSYARIVERKIGITPQSTSPSIAPKVPAQVLPPSPPEPVSPAYIWAIILIGMFIGIPLYFLPSIISLVRHKRNTLAIFLLNLLTGWTAIGWIISLVWSVTRD